MKNLWYKLFPLVVIGVFAFAQQSHAASLSLSPKQTTIAENTTIPITLLLDSSGVAVNAVEGVLHYPEDLLDIVSVNTGGSFITLWTEEPNIDREAGTVQFSGGTPNGGVAVDAPLLMLMVRAKHRGTANITINASASGVYRNDGAGTRLQPDMHDAGIEITRFDVASPRIVSPTHPDPAHWYPLRDVVVRWSVYPSVAYSYVLTRNFLEEPDTIAEETDGSMRFPNLADGIWYFVLKERLGELWSAPVRFRIMVDATPPETFTPTFASVEQSQTTLLGFSTTDATSGITQYEALIRTPRWHFFPFLLAGAWKRVESPIVFSRGDQLESVNIRAVDGAGNARDVMAVSNGLHTVQRRFLVTALVVVLLFFVAGIVLARRRR